MPKVISLTGALPQHTQCQILDDDALFPGIYTVVFRGSQEDCEAFVAKNCGLYEGLIEEDAHANMKVLGDISSKTNLVCDLIGRPLRVIRSGEAITMDFHPDRVNIEINRGNVIKKIWFG